MATLVGISAAVEPWLAAHVPGLEPPLTWTRLTGGRSNLTFAVTDRQGNRWVVRRPPLGDHPASAHDVLREAQLLRGAWGAVPVPEVVATCDDTSVTGSPFIVLSYLDGLVLRDPPSVETALSVEERRNVGPSIAGALAALHQVDPARLGLGGLVGRNDHLARQLRRWHDNWQRTATRALPDLERSFELLSAGTPPQVRTRVVHGDFRLDNCLIDRAGTVLGILDWELTTAGDPLADVGQLLVYWAEPGDEVTALQSPPTVCEGFCTREELADHYFAASGERPERLDYHVAFNWWKTACIVENVYSRMAGGQMGASDRDPESFAGQATRLAAQAAALCAALG